MEEIKNIYKNVPSYVLSILEKLNKAGFEAYIVGGCVRDLLMEREPNDWDITTKAKPDEILGVFSDGKYDNVFGTVLVKVELSTPFEQSSATPVRQAQDRPPERGFEKRVVEVTTYRSEQGYSDRRHPDEIRFEEELDKDLERRDFTINALALRQITDNRQSIGSAPFGSAQDEQDRQTTEIIDLFGGRKDIKKRVIRAVGEPMDRFKEDALRMIRAIRFSAQLDFEIEPKTERGIKKMSGSIKFISNERIKDELIKILDSDKPYEGVMNLYKTNLLRYIIPELLLGENCKQDRHHIYTVLKHNMLSLKYCPSKDWRVRMASWLHDIGKPKTRVIRKGVATFYNHEYASAKIVEKIMRRLKFSITDTKKVVNLVRYHMFYYNTDEVTATSVRRLIAKVGTENLKDLINVRIADRLGSGTPKAKPYKLRHLEYMFKRVQNDPVSVKNLKLNGDTMIADMNFKPGPKMGAILDVLLSEVIENPKLNKLEILKKRAVELDKLDIKDLRVKARETITEKREIDDKKMKKEFYVK